MIIWGNEEKIVQYRFNLTQPNQDLREWLNKYPECMHDKLIG